MAILDGSVKTLKNKEILFVPISWNRHTLEEATWEWEDDVNHLGVNK